LKGKNPTASAWISRLKNFLVVFQFAISVILIISTIMIFRQVSFLRKSRYRIQERRAAGD
jgi:hypothetical protein